MLRTMSLVPEREYDGLSIYSEYTPRILMENRSQEDKIPSRRNSPIREWEKRGNSAISAGSVPSHAQENGATRPELVGYGMIGTHSASRLSVDRRLNDDSSSIYSRLTNETREGETALLDYVPSYPVGTTQQMIDHADGAHELRLLAHNILYLEGPTHLTSHHGSLCDSVEQEHQNGSICDSVEQEANVIEQNRDNAISTDSISIFSEISHNSCMSPTMQRHNSWHSEQYCNDELTQPVRRNNCKKVIRRLKAAFFLAVMVIRFKPRRV